MIPSPLVGFGLDAQYADRYPGGITALCDRYRNRLSHLSIVSLTDVRSARWFKAACAKALPTIHHLPGVAPADVDGPHLDKLSRLDAVSKTLEAAWACEDIAIWSIGPYGIPYFTPPIFEEEVADKIADGIGRMQQISSVPFVAEIPSCAMIVGRMSMGDFFTRIVAKCGCPLVADVSHVFSYAVASGTEPSRVLHSLPLDMVWEIHVSGGHIDRLSNRRYLDTHSEPVLEDIVSLVREAAVACTGLRCVTYEVGVGLTDQEIASDLDRIEAVLSGTTWRCRLASTGHVA